MRKRGRNKDDVLLEGTMTLRCKTLASGRQSLYIDHCVEGRHRRESLSLYLEPETTVRIKRANAATMRKAEAILRERQSAMLSAQLAEIEEQEHRSTLLSSWLDTYYTYLERRGIDDLHCITTIKLRLQEYAPDATLEQVDKPFLLGFIDYLRGEYRMRNGEPLSQKSVFNLIGIFSSSLNYAVSIGRIAVNPYNLFESEERVKRGNEHKREYLTIEELKRMIETPCKHTVVRQVFLFTCFTGLRVSDVRGLRWCDLSQQDGSYTLGVRMYKTEKMVYVPLSKQAMRWMPERGGKSGDDFVFDFLPKDYNKYIASWAKAAGITKHITHHCGRHTFATMLLSLGVDIYTVSKLLGHASLRHTQRYAKIVDRQKDDAVNLADKAFK